MISIVFKLDRCQIRSCSDGCTAYTSTNLPRHAWKTDDTPCHHILDVSRNYQNTPDREDRRNLYHGPNRAAEREYTAEAITAYNAEEDWEDEGIIVRTNPNIKNYWRW